MLVEGNDFTFSSTWVPLEVSDSFVIRSNKLLSTRGNGEAKLYVGSSTDASLRMFFGKKPFKLRAFMQRDELIQYMDLVRADYAIAAFTHRGARSLPELWEKRCSQLKAKKSNIIWFDALEQRAGGDRCYLKGIGDYTASAIASFAFDLPHPVVDGNVYRFLSRFFGMDIPIDSSQGKKAFNDLALELMDEQHAAEHNQAMMEIGSQVCKPISPNCNDCPFSMACHAFLYNKASDYPVKGKKILIKKRYLHYFFVTDGISTYIKRRNEKDIWQGLFELPLVEVFELTDFPPAIPEMAKIHQPTLSKQPFKRKHILSHRVLHACFWKVKIDKCLPPKDGFLRVKLSDLSTFGFPQLIVNYFEQEGL